MSVILLVALSVFFSSKQYQDIGKKPEVRVEQAKQQSKEGYLKCI